MGDCIYSNNSSTYQSGEQMYPGEQECEYPRTGNLKLTVDQYDNFDRGCPGYRDEEEEM